jgi:hypothetical protein
MNDRQNNGKLTGMAVPAIDWGWNEGVVWLEAVEKLERSRGIGPVVIELDTGDFLNRPRLLGFKPIQDSLFIRII